MTRIKETAELIGTVIGGIIGSFVGGLILLAFLYVGFGLAWDALTRLIP